MNDFILLDQKPKNLLLPTGAELVGVNSYFNDSQSAAEFENNVADARSLLKCKSNKVGMAIEKLSTHTNNSMIIRSEDDYLIEQIDSKEFEVIAGQPSLASRSSTLGQAEDFYRQFFGQEFSANLTDPHDVDFHKINSEAQFIGHLYADELSLRRKLGVYPGVLESLATAVRAVNGRKSQRFLQKIAQTPNGIVGLTAKTESGRRAQYYIHPYEIDEFLAAIKDANRVNLEDFGEVLASVYCDAIHEYRQKLIRGEIYKTVNLYYNKIDNLKKYSFDSGRVTHKSSDYGIDLSIPKFESENKETIEKTPTSTESKLTLKEKLDALDAFTRENLGAPVSAKIVEMFPELLIQTAHQREAPSIESQTSWVERVGGERQPAVGVSNAVPDAPPALWKNGKLAGDTPPDFIKRHYGPWLNADATGLTRPDIKRLDPSLYMALANWLRKNELPDDCPVPIKSQRLDSELARVADGGLASVVSGDDPAAILRDAQRLLSAKRRRER